MSKFKGQLTIQRGHWWGLVDKVEDVSTWAPIGKVETMREVKTALECYRLAYWYCQAGILESITGPIIRENRERIVEVIRGTHKGPLPEHG